METFEHKGLTIRIEQDTGAEGPDAWGNDDLLLLTTKNRHFEVIPKGFSPASEDTASEVGETYDILPLFAYIHSGVALSLGRAYPLDDRWDSGQIGFVLIKKGVGFKDIIKSAQSLVDEWNQYLSGEVYGFIVEDSDGNHLDSCWGFYGFENCKREAESAADSWADEHEKIAKMEAGYAL